MAFLKVGKEPVKKQRLYLMEITLPSGMVVVKIGKASGENSTSRMMQIVESVYQKFRKTPMIYIKRDREVPADMVFKWEAQLHRFFSDYQYNTNHRFSGSTECFSIPLADAVMAYEAVIDGMVPDFTYVLPEPAIEDVFTFR